MKRPKCTTRIESAGPVTIWDFRPSSLVHETWQTYRPSCSCGWVGFWCATRELAEQQPLEHERPKRGAFVAGLDCSSYVVGTIDGVHVELHQFCTVAAGAFRCCGRRYTKEQAAYRAIREPRLSARHEMPTWCHLCTRPPACPHAWAPSSRDPEMERCTRCGVETLAIAPATHTPVAGDDSGAITTP